MPASARARRLCLLDLLLFTESVMVGFPGHWYELAACCCCTGVHWRYALKAIVASSSDVRLLRTLADYWQEKEPLSACGK